jgi:hypothetical protein
MDMLGFVSLVITGFTACAEFGCAGYLGHPFRKIENEQISAQ